MKEYNVTLTQRELDVLEILVGNRRIELKNNINADLIERKEKVIAELDALETKLNKVQR